MSVVVIAVSLTASCSFFRSNTDIDSSTDSDSVSSSKVPFSTKEPVVYSTEIILTTIVDGAKKEKKYLVAKSNKASFIEFNSGETSAFARIKTADGEQFILQRQNKTYRKISTFRGKKKVDPFKEFLTTKWLNQRTESSFEKIEAEKGMQKYRVKLANSTTSEAILYVDEKINLPVTQEFFRITDGAKELTYSIELKNFKTEADDGLFRIPDNYTEGTAR